MTIQANKYLQYIFFVSLFLSLLSSCNDRHDSNPENRQHGVVFVASDEPSFFGPTTALYKADFAGKKLERISHQDTSGRIVTFKVSEDGRFVAYKVTAGADFHSSVYVTDLFISSENLQSERFEYPRTVKFDYVTEYEWSPTGSQLLFNQSDDLIDTNTRLYLFNAESAQTRQLTFADRVGAIKWSPTGTHIAFIRVLNLDFSTVRYSTLNVDDLTMADISEPLMAGEQIYSDGYEWSPTGEHISYILTDASNVNQLHAVRVNGTEHTVLSDDFIGIPSRIKWAPDGQTILFMADTGSGGDNIYQTFSIKPDGTDLAQISNLLLGEEQLGFAEWTNNRNIFHSKWVPDLTRGFIESRYLSDSLGIVNQDITDPASNEMHTQKFLNAPDNQSFLLFLDNSDEKTAIEIRDGSGAYITSVEPKENSFIFQSMLPQWEPTWAPNSQYFQYTTMLLADYSYTIVIADSLGQTVLSIPDDLQNYSEHTIYDGFKWSKDSKRGVFLLSAAPYSQYYSEVYSISLGSTLPKKLSGNLFVSNRIGVVKVY